MENKDIQCIMEEIAILNKQKLSRIIRGGSMVMFQLGDYVEREFGNY